MKRIAAVVGRKAYYEAVRADLAFHAAIWQAAGSQMLARMFEHLTRPLFALASMRQGMDFARLGPRVKRHGPIIEALHARNRPWSAQPLTNILQVPTGGTWAVTHLQ